MKRQSRTKGSSRLPFVLPFFVCPLAVCKCCVHAPPKKYDPLTSENLALSLLQPWASLVVTGHKQIETRSWQTGHRGPVLIHASLGRKGKVLVSEPPFSTYITAFDALPFGAVIGRVQLDDVVPVETLFYSDARLAQLTLEEKAFGDYTRGRYAWLLSEPERFDLPIPARGSLGLWHFSGL